MEEVDNANSETSKEETVYSNEEGIEQYSSNDSYEESENKETEPFQLSDMFYVWAVIGLIVIGYVCQFL